MVPRLKSAHNEVVSGVVRRENPLFFRATILGAARSARHPHFLPTVSNARPGALVVRRRVVDSRDFRY
jgi:hypothetical protein